MIYASRLPRVEDHLARYRLADVFLDTFPYNGHTTVGDALLSGLPVVTLCGQSFASRVAYSLLHDVGLPQYASHDLAAYSAMALRLAKDAGERAHVRTHLQARLQEKSWPPTDSLQAQELIKTISNIAPAGHLSVVA